jgi:4-hydroxybenzoate polyprenyltransferase
MNDTRPLDPAAAAAADPRTAHGEPPLVVDLVGTLIRTDLLHEWVVRLAFDQPRALFSMPGWLLRGKAHFRQQVAQRIRPDPANLPYEAALIEWIREERARGRRTVLCTATDRQLAESIARSTELFDEVLASDGVVELSAEAKAQALVERFGARGFDYAGNARADLPVWARCRRAIVVGPDAALRGAAAGVAEVERDFAVPRGGLTAWWAELRLHHWPKNLLVFLPLFGAHKLGDVPALVSVCLAFLAFGLCASSVYVVNDLVDLESDRRHARKRHRPFAAGLLSIPQGLAVASLLVVAAFALAWFGVNAAFTGWLAIYLGVTVSYSLWLKRKMLVDSLVLAGLYTLRVLAGGAAGSVDPGFWLLAFSMFLFLSLALVKRCSELRETFEQGRARTPGRDYRVEDILLVEMLGIASAFSAVMVLALYINGDTVARLYPHHQAIWLTVPVLLYWVSRIWLKAHRGELEDDPVVFALTDGISRITIALFFAALVLASLP